MNYRTNEDRRCAAPYALSYNAIISVTFSAESATEPVTLADAKEWMKVDFSDSDAWITALIKMCRAAMEKYTGLGLISRTITAILNNGRGNMELPYGPVTTFTSMADKELTVITSTNYKIYGSGFQWIESPVQCYLTVVYTAGYTNVTIPQDLKMSLLQLISWCNEHRGDEDLGMTKGLLMFGAAHRRLTWLL